MMSLFARSCRPTLRLTRAYAIRPEIPILPPNRPAKRKEDDYAVPPMLPPDLGPSLETPLNAKTEIDQVIVKEGSVPFGSQPIVLENQPVTPPKSHRLRNALISSALLGALLFVGGVYGSLQDDTIYEMFTELVPYGEEAVLYMQEREFRSRFPHAHTHVSKAAPSSTSTNVYIPQSGVMPKIREDTPKHMEAKILQSGPQNSAIKAEDKATRGGSNDAQPMNKVPSSKQASSADSTSAGLDKTGKLPEAQVDTATTSAPASTTLPKDNVLKRAVAKVEQAASSALKSKTSAKPSTPVASASNGEEAPKSILKEPMPPPGPPLKTFDIPKPNHKSIEALQFALNGIIKSANEYGSAPFFKASVENAKDEIIAMNKQIAEVQAQEQLQSEKKITAQAGEFGRMQQQQIAEINAQLANYEKQMSMQLEQEKNRLNQAYSERLEEEIKRIESINEQKLRNELLEQAIEMQKTLAWEVKSRVEEERGGRLGKLENLQKSIAELKQLNVDSSSFIDDRARLQKLEIALNALKGVLYESKPRSFRQELTAVKDIAGSDELVKATIDTINKESSNCGVPSLGQLGDRFRTVADEVRKAALVPDDAGLGGHATSWLLSKIMFRKRGMVPGTDVEAVLARAEAYLEANDLDSATREMNSLTGWAHIISSDWLKMARHYLELQQAIELIENSVILQKLKTQ